MKFVVCVGKEFPCNSVNIETTQIVVNVIQNSSPDRLGVEQKKSHSFLWYCGTFIGAFAVFSLIACTIYGSVINDYSSLKTLVDSIQELIFLVIKVFKQS
jgi:hypothetical protein